jgi:hypothetical protein
MNSKTNLQTSLLLDFLEELIELSEVLTWVHLPSDIMSAVLDLVQLF